MRELAGTSGFGTNREPHRKHVNRAHSIPLEVYDRESVRGVDERYVLLARHELCEHALLATAFLALVVFRQY